MGKCSKYSIAEKLCFQNFVRHKSDQLSSMAFEISPPFKSFTTAIMSQSQLFALQSTSISMRLFPANSSSLFFFLISVFALQCISMAIFHGRGHSQFETGKNDDEHNITQNYTNLSFFSKCKIALKFTKSSSELFGRITNSDKQ